MYKGVRVLCVVPARGGSKGIKLKNLRKVKGFSLVARAGRLVQRLEWLDRAIVSSDHDDILREGIAFGLTAPFKRPEDLSADRVADWPVLNHALVEMEKRDGCRYDVVIMLQPTCPMRRPEHVTDCLDRLVESDLDAVWTVSETDSKAHPLKQLTIVDGRLDYYDPRGAAIIARQQLTPVYHRNGACYAIRRECLLEKGNIKGDRTGALVIEEPLANIDTPFDLMICEFMMENQTGE